MQQPLQITFRDIAPSANLQNYITEQAQKFEHFFKPIIACHIIIEQSQKHQHQGKLYKIRIHVLVPEKSINSFKGEDENPYTAMQMAFDNTKQQLDEYRDKLQGFIKSHPERLQGEVVRIFDKDNFGFLTDTVGEEYYFSMGALHNTQFNRLKIGDKVHFIPWVGEEGLQAHRVCVVKHH